MILPSISLQAQSRLLTLAMLRPDDLLVRRVATGADRLTIETPITAPSQRTAKPTPSIHAVTPEKLTLTMPSLIERRQDSETANSFSLSRISLRDFDRPNAWASFQVGYGQVFYDKTPTLYGRNGAWFEEPSFGFFKICFSF